MTAAALPASYDFDEHWSPLPRLDQGVEGTCWYHQWAVHLAALRRMWDGWAVDYTAAEVGAFTQDPDGCGFIFHVTDRDMHVRNHSGCADPRYFADPTHPTPDEMRRAIIGNGVVELSIASRGGYIGSAGRDRPTLPLIDVGPGMPAAPVDHSTLAVGFTPDGVICHNSWGAGWACHGRAVLSWAWLAFYGCMLQVDSYGDHPVDGLVLPPVHGVPAQPPQPPPAGQHRNPFPVPDFTAHPVAFTHLTSTPAPAVQWAQWALGVPTTGKVDRGSQLALLRWRVAHRLPAVAVVDGPAGRGLAKITR